MKMYRTTHNEFHGRQPVVLVQLKILDVIQITRLCLHYVTNDDCVLKPAHVDFCSKYTVVLMVFYIILVM
jgi:hypothetical protein